MNNNHKFVLLFNSPIIIKEKVDKLEMGNMFPRIGIASIAACLKKEKIKVGVFDPSGESERTIVSFIKKFKPDIVGIPAFTSEIYDANETTRLVKKINQKIVTVVGGAHSSALPKRTLEEFYFIDIVCYGEGERTMVDLAKGKPLDKILGIAYRSGSEIIINKPQSLVDLNSLPFPAWELFDLEKYKGGSINSGFKKTTRELEIPIEGARGCPFNCNFCFRINGRSIRYKNPKRILEEVRIAVEVFGATNIHFVEGTFGVDRKKAEALCDLLIKSELNKKITWSSGGRVNVLNEELLKKMKQSGCVYLGYGVESGDNEMLAKMGKQITTKQTVEVFDLCKKIGITTEANFIIGHPFETEEKVLKTIKFAKGLNTNYVSFAIMVPFPGTQVYKMAKKGIGGLRLLTYDWKLYGKQIGAALESEQLPQKKLIELQNKAYFQFYFRLHRLPSFLKRLTFARLSEAVNRILH